MSRKYNHKLYGGVKKFNAVVRDKCSPDPGGALKAFGVIGKILGFIITKIIAFPIHLLAFAITGLFYNKRKDSPYKGSFLYTVVSIGLMFLVTGAIGLVVKLIA